MSLLISVHGHALYILLHNRTAVGLRHTLTHSTIWNRCWITSYSHTRIWSAVKWNKANINNLVFFTRYLILILLSITLFLLFNWKETLLIIDDCLTKHFLYGFCKYWFWWYTLLFVRFAVISIIIFNLSINYLFIKYLFQIKDKTFWIVWHIKTDDVMSQFNIVRLHRNNSLFYLKLPNYKYNWKVYCINVVMCK